MWFRALLLVFFFLLDLLIILLLHERRLRFQVNAGLMLVTSFFAYTAALPFSRLVLGTEPSTSGVDIDYMWDNLLAALGLTLGLALYRKSFHLAALPPDFRGRLNVGSSRPIKKGVMVMTAVLIVAATSYYSLSSAGFSIDKLAAAYGETDITSANVTIVDTLLLPLTICTLLHCMYAVKVRQLRGAPVLVVFALSLSLLGLFFFQGHRNLILFLGLSLLGLWKYGQPIRIATFSFVVVVAIVGFYTVGIVRNWGWLHLDQVSLGEDNLDPLRGELGASFSVYEKMPQGGVGESLQLGRSYTWDTAVNLIPQQLWRTRPPSPAMRFSIAYYETEDLKSGLGFSPLVESIMNFSRYGIPVIFAFTAVMLIAVDRSARSHGRVGILISCVLLPSVVNWNRIDFATTLKMFLVYAGILWALDKLFYSRAAQYQSRLTKRPALRLPESITVTPDLARSIARDSSGPAMQSQGTP